MATKNFQMTVLPYEGKLWQGEMLANLANDHKFAQSNFMLQIYLE